MNNPKKIATLNLKGGVGKTTMTWWLSHTIANIEKSKVLMFDLDPQMSLTFSVAVNTDSGLLNESFAVWHENAREKRTTISNVVTDYLQNFGNLQALPNCGDFIFEYIKNIHIIPSVEELYMLELDMQKTDVYNSFLYQVIQKIQEQYQRNNYQYIFFDCPPTLTPLTYSVLQNCDIILVPVNPDYYASRCLAVFLSMLKKSQIKHNNPVLGVFLNRAKYYRSELTKEASIFWNNIKEQVEKAQKDTDLRILCFDTLIAESSNIKDIQSSLSKKESEDFGNLWKEIKAQIP
jgi:cellulose biosynthesis protein BcsQ